ncbi:hypothetical protein HanLR1_Chr17g0665141 [Helianthus annuus]|nr:hypothetical protein HanHA89_Chr17g0706461 [Helianthus annuus]KAJ0632439.1 hypothetical protein HanLR1_Chr17g0665141 [Helianthus annuus]
MTFFVQSNAACNALTDLFISIRMCKVISGSDPPLRTESTACFTFSVGDMRILINSPNTLGLLWSWAGPKSSEAAFLIST